MLYSVKDPAPLGERETSGPERESAIPWLISALALQALNLGLAFYLVERQDYEVLPALGVSLGVMVATGVAIRLALPSSVGGWAVGVPIVRVASRVVHGVLRPWLQPGPYGLPPGQSGPDDPAAPAPDDEPGSGA